MRVIKSSIKRALYALGLSQKTIAHLGFSYTRGKRNVRIGVFVGRQILIGGGGRVKGIQLVAIKQGACLLLVR